MSAFFRRHLVVQIGVVVTLVSLVTVVLISLATYTSVRDTLQQATFENVEKTAQTLDNALHLWLEEQQQDFAEVILDPEITANALRLIAQPPASRQNSPDYRYLKQKFDRQVEVNLDFEEVAVLSARAGEVLLSSNDKHEGFFEKDSQVFRGGLQKPNVHPLYTRVDNLRPSMALSSPIKNANGDVQGVLMVYLNLQGLIKELHIHPDVYSVGAVYLVDRNHVPIGYLGEWAENFPRGLHSQGIEAALGSSAGVRIYSDYRDRQVVGSYRWLERFGAALLVEVPVSEAFYPARNLGWMILVIGGLGGLLFSGALILLAKKIVRPVLEVSRAARGVAQGDLHVATLSTGPAEIGVLVESFNEMVHQIHDLVDDVRDREERYRTVFNATDEAIFIHAADSSRVIDYNRAACRIFGLTEGETVDDVAELSAGYPPYASEDALEKLRAAVEQGGQTFEWRSRRKSGELFWTEVALSEMTIAGEQRILAVVRDIDQRKRNEAELEEYRKNLEWTIADRTRQLEEAQENLLNQEKLAVLGQLTATVSHELRNPLGTMSNALFALEAALAAGATDKARTSLEMIDRNVRRCDKIIGELLDFTRRHESDMRPTNLDDLVSGVLDEYALPDGVTLRRELNCAREVVIDQESMRRALINLLDNAVQALQDDAAYGKMVRVETLIKAGRAQIRVSDEGPGIAEEHRQAIFEPLFSTKEFGVGLGVTIIHNVVQQHGGSLDYYCPADGGTVAVVSLPLSG